MGPFSATVNLEAKWCKHSGSPGPQQAIPKIAVDLRGGLLQVCRATRLSPQVFNWPVVVLFCFEILHQNLDFLCDKEVYGMMVPIFRAWLKNGSSHLIFLSPQYSSVGWGLAAVVGVFRVLCSLSSQSNLRVSSSHSFISRGSFGIIPLWTIPRKCSVNSCGQVFPWTYSLVSLGCKTESGNVWGNFLLCGVSNNRAVSLYQVSATQHTELCHSFNFLRRMMLGY